MKNNNPYSALHSFFKGLFKAAFIELLPDIITALKQQGFQVESPRDEFLDAPASADFIGESLSSFYHRTSKREIPFYKRGKKIFCKRSELTEWLEAGKHPSRFEIRSELQHRKPS
ncbi:helix-turn-helix domain-containing protein [Rapidithrix thailandica]|uniref:Helix-turn-helix domain-containing protein n=1 Tax=Rapidithrix thailandica TaxID=413964 RepID=A0AAW9S894_9BACT